MTTQPVSLRLLNLLAKLQYLYLLNLLNILLYPCIVTEQKEKEKRQLNVIVYKLDEYAANDGPARKSDDFKRCESVFRHILGSQCPLQMKF